MRFISSTHCPDLSRQYSEFRMTFSQVTFAPGNCEKYWKLLTEMKPDHDRKWLTAPEAQMYWHKVVKSERITVFKKQSDLGFSFISVWCVCPRIKSSNHSAKVTFTQRTWFESLAFVDLILRQVGISPVTFSSCVSIVVSKHCVNLIFPSCRWAMCCLWPQPEVLKELAGAAGLLGDWGCGCPVHIRIFFFMCELSETFILQHFFIQFSFENISYCSTWIKGLMPGSRWLSKKLSVNCVAGVWTDSEQPWPTGNCDLILTNWWIIHLSSEMSIIHRRLFYVTFYLRFCFMVHLGRLSGLMKALSILSWQVTS